VATVSLLVRRETPDIETVMAHDDRWYSVSARAGECEELRRFTQRPGPSAGGTGPYEAVARSYDLRLFLAAARS